MATQDDWGTLPDNVNEGTRKMEPTGTWRSITHLNPDMGKIGVEINGTTLATGGFSAKDGSGCWMFGTLADVPHDNKTEREIVAKSLANVAVLGWAPRHKVLQAKVGDKFRVSTVSDFPQGVLPEGCRVRGQSIFYITFKDDPDREVHQVVLRGTVTTPSATVESALIRAARRASAIVNAKRRTAGKAEVNLHTYSLWVTLGVGRPVESGQPGQQGQIAPLVVDCAKWGTDQEFADHLVSPSDYVALTDRYKSVLDLIDATDWVGQPAEVTLAGLLTGSQVGDGAALLAAAKTNPMELPLSEYLADDTNLMKFVDALRKAGIDGIKGAKTLIGMDPYACPFPVKEIAIKLNIALAA